MPYKAQLIQLLFPFVLFAEVVFCLTNNYLPIQFTFGRLQSTSNRRNIDHIVKGNKENQYAKKEWVVSLCTDCFDRFTCNPCDLTTSRTFCISLLA